MNYKSLPISERIELVEDIWDSIAEETTGSAELGPQQLAELRSRLAAHQADPASSIPWEKVRADLFKSQA